jgi:hypothetical protein
MSRPISSASSHNRLSNCPVCTVWLLSIAHGGERAATIYSLLGTAKLNALDPEGYLRYVLTHIAEHPINRASELLPWNIAEHLQRDQGLNVGEHLPS